MSDVKEIVTTFRAKLAAFTDEAAEHDEGADVEVLLKLDESANRLSGVLNFIAKIEQGTKNYPPKCLTSDAVHTMRTIADAMRDVLDAMGVDGSAFRSLAEQRLIVAELPPIDESARKSIARQFDELIRTVSNVELLMAAGDVKRVPKAAASVASMARRISKSQVLNGFYQPVGELQTVLFGCVTEPAEDALKPFDDWRERIDRLVIESQEHKALK